MMMLIDLDELDALNAGLRLFSVGKPNLMDFRPSDHLQPERGSLRGQVEQILLDGGLAPGGRVRLLCMPRVLGAVFNPLSVYFCEDPEGRLQAILYEVNNTFGQRHAYLLRADGAARIEQVCEKAFYVSPFNGMDLRYRFKVTPPGPLEDEAPLSVRIEVDDLSGPVLTAAFSGRRSPLTDAAIVSAWLRHPVLAAKVVGAIHWEALKLWMKGVRLTPRPPPPACPVSLPRSAASPVAEGSVQAESPERGPHALDAKV
jgi:DUF1365 family protein